MAFRLIDGYCVFISRKDIGNGKGQDSIMELTKCLKDLCEAVGTAGLREASQTAASYLREYMEDVSVDDMGNVLGLRRCGRDKAPCLLLEAHIDEIGFLVTGVDEQGFVHVSPYGGVDPRVLAAAEVIVWADKPYKGVFCSTPPHLSGGSEGKLPDIPQMGIDIGMAGDGENAKKAIQPGCPVTFRPGFVPLAGSCVSSKSLDDRAGVASILFCLELLKDVNLSVDIAVAFAVQEELGCRGSAVAAYKMDPDKAIAVDVSFALTPDADASKCGIMGKGPMIGIAPTLDNRITQTLESLAKEEKIPFQREVMGGDTGTDADSIAGVRAGVPTGLLSIPLRYMHTPVETVDVADVENTGRLMAAYVLKEGAAQ